MQWRNESFSESRMRNGSSLFCFVYDYGLWKERRRSSGTARPKWLFSMAWKPGSALGHCMGEMSSFFGIKEACSQAFQLYVRHALSHFNMSALPTNWHISILLVSEWSCFEHVASRMTANALFLKSGWITANAPLRNGVGRFIPQLARVTLKFCKAHGDSNGVRWNQFVFWIGEIESYHFEHGTHNYWVQHLGYLVWTLFSIAGKLPKKKCSAVTSAPEKFIALFQSQYSHLSGEAIYPTRCGSVGKEKPKHSGLPETEATQVRSESYPRVVPLSRGIFKSCLLGNTLWQAD